MWRRTGPKGPGRTRYASWVSFRDGLRERCRGACTHRAASSPRKVSVAIRFHRTLAAAALVLCGPYRISLQSPPVTQRRQIFGSLTGPEAGALFFDPPRKAQRSKKPDRQSSQEEVHGLDDFQARSHQRSGNRDVIWKFADNIDGAKRFLVDYVGNYCKAIFEKRREG